MTIRDRIKKLERQNEPPQPPDQVHAIPAWDDEEFEQELTLKRASGEIRPRDLVVHIRMFG